MKLATTLLLALAACGVRSEGNPDASGPELLDGFTPPAPGPGEIQFVSPILRDIAPGADVTFCSYLPEGVSFTATSDIVAGHGYQSGTGSHHAILFLASRNRPVDSHLCTDDDMTNTRFLVGAGGGDAGGGVLDIPPGIAFRIDAGKQLMIQSHWINATDHAIDGQAAFNVRVQPPSDTVQTAQLLNWGTSHIDIAPGADGTAHAECTVGRDLKLFVLGGHAHEWGTRVRLGLRDAAAPPTAAPAETTFYDEPWMPYYAFDPPRQRFEITAPKLITKGQTLTADCDYHNDTAAALGFPREMCVGFAFYFPGDAEIDCFDNEWPAP